MGNKTTTLYKQNPLCNGYYVISKLNDILQSDYHHSLLDYNNVDGFVNEVIKLENKMNFYFKNTKKDIIMSQEDEKHFRNTDICWFCESEVTNNKVRDHCDLAGICRGAAHEKCNIIVRQKQSNFITLAFHNFSNYDCNLFFKTLIDRKPDKVI